MPGQHQLLYSAIPTSKTLLKRNVIPRHMGLNSLVRNKMFLKMLNKGLPEYSGREGAQGGKKGLTIKEPAATVTSDG